MHFEEGQLYHVYNRGNNKQTIFFSEEDYFSFLEKAHLYLKPRCDIFDWCFMPNHFHFLVHANHKSIIPTPNVNIPMQHLADGIRLTLSSYAKK
ncbi:MAG TPA: hypothetical protein VE978_17735 [Chitinophagales bacterium]|nr:hypothetical protein [Chitinophagales bacterium]